MEIDSYIIIIIGTTPFKIDLIVWKLQKYKATFQKKISLK